MTALQKYWPYGEIRSDMGAGVMPTDIGFTAQRADSTGLMFYNARYYSPYLNRWIQPDTIVPDPGNPQTLNRYSYSNNNPVKYIDPSGHWPAWFDYALGAGYQITNDQLLGVPNLIFGTAWQDKQSYAFQCGQQAGRDASAIISAGLTVDGALKAGEGMAMILGGGGGGLALAPATGGGSVVMSGVAVPAGSVLGAMGTVESAYGLVALAIMSKNPLEGPSYSARNFRSNLENLKTWTFAKMDGMNLKNQLNYAQRLA